MVRNPHSELSVFDAFLFALLEQGFTTPYALKRAVNLSVGATVPALRRLEGKALVERGHVGTRRKQEFHLTQSGKRALEKGIGPLFQTPLPRDLESIARLLALALHYREGKAARTVLSLAIEDRRRRVGSKTPQRRPTGLVNVYAWVLSSCDSARAKADVAALRKLLRLLPR